MKTICIYYSRDLDGWMSAAIVKKWFIKNTCKEKEKYSIEENDESVTIENLDMFPVGVNTLDFLGWDYGDKIPDLSEYDKVIMCDISFPMEDIYNQVSNIGNDMIWIDRHKSAIEAFNIWNQSYGEQHLEGLRDTSFAACELTWKYFFPNEEMPEIVRLLGRYDCFGHKGTEEEQKVLEFQYASRAKISNYEEAYNWLTQWTFGHTQSWLQTGRDIYQYLRTEAKQTYKKAFEIELGVHVYKTDFKGQNGVDVWQAKKFLCVNQDRFNPVNFVIDYHKEGYDGFACFWYKDGKWMWSLYNDNSEVDCSVIAKQYGGGDHKGAAGFVCNNDIMLKIINNDK